MWIEKCSRAREMRESLLVGKLLLAVRGGFRLSLEHVQPHFCEFLGEGEKIGKRWGPGGGLLMVPCSGFYVLLKSVFPLIRFSKGRFGELVYRFR